MKMHFLVQKAGNRGWGKKGAKIKKRQANREVTRFNVSVNLWHAVKMTGNTMVAVSTTLYILYFIIGKSINYSKYV